jgi:hypothetical protein
VVAVVGVRQMNHEVVQILEAQVVGVVITVVQHHFQLLVVVAEVLHTLVKLLVLQTLEVAVEVVVTIVVVNQVVLVLCLFVIHHLIKLLYQFQEHRSLKQVDLTIIDLLVLEAFNSKKKFDRSINM